MPPRKVDQARYSVMLMGFEEKPHVYITLKHRPNTNETILHEGHFYTIDEVVHQENDDTLVLMVTCQTPRKDWYV